MKKVIIITLALFVVLLTLSGCGTSFTSATESNASNEVGKSNLVFSLDGSGNKTSETFYITSEDWYIDWNYQGTGIGVTIYLYPQNAIHFKDLWIDSFGSNTPGANRVYFHNQTGGFYLYILAVGEWQIEVYE